MFVFQFYGFKERHHDKLSLRIAQNVDKRRAKALTEESLQTYFDLIDKKIRELKLEDKPMNIFNCDETGLSGDQGKKRVLFKRGNHSPKLITGNNEKQHFTIQVLSLFKFHFMSVLLNHFI